MSPIEQYAPEILSKIKSAKHILLSLHPSPDGDSVGGALATMFALQSLNKQVTVIKGDSPRTESFIDVPGFDQIVDKNWFELDLGDYDVFLSLDAATLGLVSSLGEVVFPEHLSVAVIDHHGSNNAYGQINLIDKSYSSNCQLLFDLFTNWGITITEDMAKCLMIGIYTDSGGFRYLPTDYKTFLAGSALSKIAPDYNLTISSFLDHNSLGRVKFLGVALSKLKGYLNNKVYISKVSNQDLLDNQLDVADTEKSDVANYLKSINGAEIGVILVEKYPDQIAISFRARDSAKFNVSEVAKTIGGGGHPGAAAAKLSTSLDDALEQTLKAIQEVYPNI